MFSLLIFKFKNDICIIKPLAYLKKERFLGEILSKSNLLISWKCLHFFPGQYHEWDWAMRAE